MRNFAGTAWECQVQLVCKRWQALGATGSGAFWSAVMGGWKTYGREGTAIPWSEAWRRMSLNEPGCSCWARLQTGRMFLHYQTLSRPCSWLGFHSWEWKSNEPKQQNNLLINQIVPRIISVFCLTLPSVLFLHLQRCLCFLLLCYNQSWVMLFSLPIIICPKCKFQNPLLNLNLLTNKEIGFSRQHCLQYFSKAVISYLKRYFYVQEFQCR